MTRIRWVSSTAGWAALIALGSISRAPGTLAATTDKAATAATDAAAVADAECQSQFVSVEIEPGQTCQGISLAKSKWQLVPPPLSAGAAKGGDPAQPRQSAQGGRPFCVLEWSGSGAPAFAQLKEFKARRECPLVVSPFPGQPSQVADLPARDKEALAYDYKSFLRQVVAVDAKVGDLWKVLPKPVAPPAIAVLDATPYGTTRPDASGHGFAVSRVIAQLACADPDSAECASQVKPYVALPLAWEKKRRRWTRGDDGGHVGYFHHLYDAFVAALEVKDRHLIINLSLGWDPSSRLPDDWQRRQMWALLLRASCEGALVIGASGNGNAVTRGPLAPALFEREAAPDAARCRELGFDTKDPTATAQGGAGASAAKVNGTKAAAAAYRPLIHAVGGVDFFDERLATLRRDSHPRLAAFAMEAAVSARPSPTGYTIPRSSPSLSAAAVSGMAAVVWALRPDLDAHQVMAAVYEGGVPLEGSNLGSHTEICLDTGKDRCRSWPARRAHLCGAINAALGPKKVACVEPLAFDRRDERARAFFLPPPPRDTKPTAVRPMCPVAGCGAPYRMDPTQIPLLIDPLGVSTCAFCRVYPNYFGPSSGLFEGTVMLQPTSGFTVNLYESDWTPHSYAPLGPNPPAGAFRVGLQTIDTGSAVLVWTGEIGGLGLTVESPLQVSP